MRGYPGSAPRNSADKYGHVQKEFKAFFKKANLGKIEHDRRTLENIDQLRRLNAERRAADKRDLDDEYRNYIPPIV